MPSAVGVVRVCKPGAGACEGRATAKEIARATELPLATAYHLLRTCTYEGWLQRLDDGTYVLGHRLDTVHRRGRDAAGIAVARPALEWLRDAAGGPVYLARCVDGEIVVVEGSTAWPRPSSSRSTWRRSGWWYRLPHARAAGRARRWSSAPGGCPVRSSCAEACLSPIVTI